MAHVAAEGGVATGPPVEDMVGIRGDGESASPAGVGAREKEAAPSAGLGTVRLPPTGSGADAESGPRQNAATVAGTADVAGFPPEPRRASKPPKGEEAGADPKLESGTDGGLPLLTGGLAGTMGREVAGARKGNKVAGPHGGDSAPSMAREERIRRRVSAGGTAAAFGTGRRRVWRWRCSRPECG